jgi:hypothetical protein
MKNLPDRPEAEREAVSCDEVGICQGDRDTGTSSELLTKCRSSGMAGMTDRRDPRMAFAEVLRVEKFQVGSTVRKSWSEEGKFKESQDLAESTKGAGEETPCTDVEGNILPLASVFDWTSGMKGLSQSYIPRESERQTGWFSLITLTKRFTPVREDLLVWP